jgi:hypothetical protein
MLFTSLMKDCSGVSFFATGFSPTGPPVGLAQPALISSAIRYCLLSLFDVLVKSQLRALFVLPAKAGIQ